MLHQELVERCSLQQGVLLFLCLLAMAARPAFADRLPVEAFAKLPSVHTVKLSPTGKHLAVVANTRGESYLFTHELATGKKNMIVKTDNEKYIFRWIEWANDDRILASLWFPDRRYGVATGETRLVSVGIEDNKIKVLSKPPSRWDYSHVSQYQDTIISYLPDDPEQVLIGLDTDEVAFPEVYKLNVYTGKKRRVLRHKKPVRHWVADQQGVVRAGRGLEKESTIKSLWVRRPGSEEWHLVEEYDSLERPTLEPLGFGLDPDLLYIRDVHEGKQAIFTLDTASPDFERELVYADPKSDVTGGLVYSRKTRDVVGIRHWREKGGVHYLDEEAERFQMALDKALPDTQNFIDGFSDDEMTYLLYSSSHNSPGVHYVGDRLAGTTKPISHRHPELFGKTMADYEFIRYKTVDGTSFGGYLWRWPDAQREDLPLVVLPRYGNSSSDRGGFDYLLQFLASRGYAVFQPNTRSGQGNTYTAVNPAWGATALSDIADGVRHLVGEGLVDPDRVCILGSGYAGYVALMSLVKHPGLYACGISLGAITSLQDYRNTKRHFIDGTIVRGHMGRDKDFLKQYSPRDQVKQIKSPVLLAHGERDRTAIISHGRKMAAALKKSDLPHEYLELEEGNGFLSNEQHRLDFFSAVDSFLARHNPVER